MRPPATADGRYGRSPRSSPIAPVQPHTSYSACEGERAIGALDVHGARTLPVALPVGFSVAQDREGTPLITKVRGRARIGLVKAGWSFDADGPMSFLAGRKAVLTLVLRPLRIVFGS